MNRLCFRLVFNPTRGIPMAVAENARSHPKGGTPGRSASPGRSVRTPCQTHLRALTAGVMLITGSLLWPAQVSAQIVADGRAPGSQRPTILTAPNGVPLVNIQTPSAAGVSRNTYSQFDVPAAGTILNNARNSATTRLGGLVQGNPWLATGTARVILNEVNAANPSQLLGYLEVGGARAEVIIANPAGILCNGCGFINASRATLTTGTPVITDGRLDGYRVGTGTLVVDGLGLDARDTDFTQLIARAIRLNAGVWAPDLQAITGAADVAADGSVAAPRPPAGSAPAFALDVAVLGGMYAGKIHLIGTEAGVGFRNTGQIGASAGEVRIDQRGWIDNSGQIDSATRLTITTPETLTSSGALRAGTDAVLSGHAGLSLDGSAVAGGDLSLSASAPGARLTSGADAWLVAGHGNAGGMLSLSAAGPLAAHGTLIGGAAIDTSAASLDHSTARFTAPAVQLRATQGDLNLSASRLHTEGRLTASTPGLLRSATANISAGQLALAAHDLDNTGGVLLHLSTDPLQLVFAGTFNNSSGRLASNAVAINLGAATLFNRGGQIEHRGNGTLSLRADTFSGSDGQLITQGQLDLTAGHLDLDRAQTQATHLTITAAEFSHRQGTLLQTGSAPASLTVNGQLHNQNGHIGTNADLALTVGSLNNDGGRLEAQHGSLAIGADFISNTRGQLYTTGDLRVTAGTLTNHDGSAYAMRDVALALAGGLESSGTLAAARHLGVSAAWIQASPGSHLAAGLQPDGRLEGDGSLTLQARSALAAHGQNLAAGGLSIAASSLDLSGSTTRARNLTLSADLLDAHAARLVANGQLQAQISGHLDSRDAYLSADHLDLSAASLDNRGGALISSGTRAAHLQVHDELTNRGGQIASNADLTLNAATLDNRGGSVVATQDAQLTVRVAGLLDNTGGLIAGNHGLTLGASRLANAAGQLEAATGSAHLSTDFFDNASGRLFAATNFTLRGGELANGSGSLYAGRDANLALSGALQHDGVIAAARHLDVSAARINATSGSLLAAGMQTDGHLADTGSLNVQASSAITAHGQHLAAGALSLSAPALDLGSSLNAAHAIRLAADTLSLSGANVRAETTLNAQAGDLLDTRAARVSAAELSLQARRLDNTGGDLRQTGGGALHIALPGALTNTGGQILSNGDSLHLSAAGMDNRSGLIGHAGGGTLTIDTTNFTGSGGQIISNGQLNLSTQRLVLDNATSQADTWHISASTLDHQRGKLLQTGSGTSTLSVAAQFDNNAGRVSSNGGLAVAAGQLDNLGGTLLATLDLNLQAANLNNPDGTLYAGRNVTLAVADTLTHGGVLGAGRDLGITAGTVAAGAGSLLAAGLQADGHLAGDGSLSLSAQRQLDAHGRQLAAGSLMFDAAQLELSASQSAAASIQLTARSGDLRATGADISASNRLQTQVAGLLDTRLAHLNAAALILRASALDNTDGEIVQTGSSDQHLELPGTLVNTRGRIASNGNALSLAAATLDNTTGRIEHAATGQLSIRAATLLGDGGQIASAGKLDLVAHRVELAGASTQAVGLALSADSLNNQGGTLWQTGTSEAHINVASILDNRDGQIAGNGAVKLAANVVDNRHGEIASTQALTAAANRQFDNRDGGRVHAGHDGLITTSVLANTNGEITAGSRLDVTATTLGNASGLIAAGTDLNLTGAEMDNRSGSLAAIAGGLTLTAGGLTTNAGGHIAAARSLTLASGQLDNTRGTLVASSATVTSRGPLANRDGHIVASGSQDAGTLTVTSGPLDNQGGLIQASGHLLIDTRGADLVNRATLATGGIFGGADVVLRSGLLDNQAGYIGAGRLEVLADKIDNTIGGTVASLGVTTVTATALHNADGRIHSAGDLSLTVASSIDNTRGAIQSTQHAQLSAAAILNNSTRGPGLGIQGRTVELVTPRLDNRDGLLAADDSLRVTSTGHIDNTRGLLSALGSVVLHDPNPRPTLAIINSGGEILAGRQLSISAATLGGDGRLLSWGDLDLHLAGDFGNNGEIRANGNARLALSGTFTNSASLAAGGHLDLRVAALDNRATGEMQAGSALLASSTLVNRGLIDASDARLESALLDNLGSGRIYGDNLAIQAATLTNAAEDGSAPVIAARKRLDMGIGNLINSEHGLLFSAGDLVIGGGLDTTSHASGQARTVINRSATIEALGNLTLSAERIENLDTHFATEVVRTSVTAHREFSFKEHPERYDASEVHYEYSFDDDGVRTLVVNQPYDDGRLTSSEWFVEYNFNRTVDEVRLLASDPARILAGSNLHVTSAALTNDMSQIIAGRQLRLELATLDNRTATGTRTATDIGEAIDYWRFKEDGRDSQGTLLADYAPAPRIQTYALVTPILAENTTVAGSGTSIGHRSIDALVASATGSHATTPASRTPVLIEVRSSVDTGNRITGKILDTATPTTIARDTGVVPTSPAVTIPPLAQINTTDSPSQTVAQSTPVSRDAATAADSVTPRTSAIPTGNTIASNTQTVVRSIAPSFTLPNSSLFRLNADTRARYLIETDPRFTDARLWLSSDYLLGQLASDPNAVQKRLGDGFYEQRLVREQIAQLTGQRFLDGYTDDETQFAALMTAGARFAKAWQLRPGVALSAEQMAALTTDIVWLVSTPITLADGSVTQVLVPQVYAVVRDGDIDGAGGLLAGASLSLAAQGNVKNSGTLAARERLDLTADTLRNAGGRISSSAVDARTLGDLENIGGRIEASRALTLLAGRDLTVASTTASTQSRQGSRTAVDRTATVYVGGGDLTLEAGRDLHLDASQLINLAPTGAGPAGSTTLVAGRNLDLGTLAESRRQEIVWNARNYRRDGEDREIGSTIHTTGDLHLQAGQDITARAAQLTSDHGALTVTAGRDLTLMAGTQRQLLDEAHQYKQRSLLSSTTITTRDTLDSTTALASTLSGDTTTLYAGRDIRVMGSNVVSTEGTALVAQRNFTVESIVTSNTQSHQSQTKKSGLLGGSGVGFTIGSQQLKDATSDTNVVHVGSTIGAVDGSLLVSAKGDVAIKSSDMLAGEDIALMGRNVSIEAQQDKASYQESHEFKQSGVTLALKSAIIDTAQAVDASAQRAQEAQDGRLGALHAAKAGATAYASYGAMTKEATAISKGDTGSVSIQVSVSSSRSQSRSEATSTLVRGSYALAGGNIGITAIGEQTATGLPVDGTGDLEVVASALKGQNVTLTATRDMLLQSGQNMTDQHSSNSIGGWSVGVGVSLGKQTGITLNGSAYAGSGGSDGKSVQQVTTQVEASDTLVLRSGRDTVLEGAQAVGSRLEADIGRNLTIQSVQDTMRYHADQHQISAGASATYGTGGGSANIAVNWSRAHADYASVNRQSGLFGGAGGYDVDVGQHTQLDGSAISSTAAPNDNRLSTNSLAYTDIDNHKEASASAGGVNLSSDIVSNPGYGLGKSAFGSMLANASKASSDNSTTYAVIGAGTREIRSGDRQASDTLKRDLEGATRSLTRDDIGAIQSSVNRSSEAGTLIADIAAVLADEGIRKYLNPTLHKVFCIQQPCTNDQEQNSRRLAESKQQIASAHPEWSDEQVQTEALAAITAYNPNRNLDANAVKQVARGEQSLDSDLTAQNGHEKINNILTLPATVEELKALSNDEKKGSSVFSNGIFNSLDRAAQLALQMTPTGKDYAWIQSQGETTLNTTYLVHTDEANNSAGELIVSVVEKAAEIFNIPSPAGRLKAAVIQELLLQRDAEGKAEHRSADGSVAYENPIYDLGHSRGTMTQRGELSMLAEWGVTKAPLTVLVNNPAADQKRLTAAAGEVSRITPPSFWAPPNDPVAVVIGGYPGTLSWSDIAEMDATSYSVHSCGGTAALGCDMTNVNPNTLFRYQGLDINKMNQNRQPSIVPLLNTWLSTPPPATVPAMDINVLQINQNEQRWHQQTNLPTSTQSGLLERDSPPPVPGDTRFDQLEKLRQQLEIGTK